MNLLSRRLLNTLGTKRGLWAENRAAAFLENKGYSILERRVLFPRIGEIDLIAQDAMHLIFVEVKCRPTEQEALESITPKKIKNLVRASEIYMGEHPHYYEYTLRFDLLLVTSSGVIHKENVWFLDETKLYT